mgnify:CR=1 FL=1
MFQHISKRKVIGVVQHAFRWSSNTLLVQQSRKQPLAEVIYINELYYTDPYDGLPGVYGRHIVPPSVMLKAIKDNAGYFIASK